MSKLPHIPSKSNLEAALALARAGWKIFPVWEVNADGSCACGNPTRAQVGKHPSTYHGALDAVDASTEEGVTQLEIWWGAREAPVGFTWEASPTRNIAIAIPDDVIVVDCDPRNGGDKTAAALEAKHGPWPQTRTVASGSGGWHRYYLVPEGLAFPKTAGAGIDLKTLGGYCLAEGSNHKSGGRYELTDDREMVDAPAWLVALNTGKRKARPKARAATARNLVDMSDAVKAEADRIIAIVEPHYVEGSKHAIACGLGGYLKKSGKSASFVEHIVSQLPSDDVEMRVSSALTYYDYANPAGYSKLAEHMPADALAELEGVLKAQRSKVSSRQRTRPAQAKFKARAPASVAVGPSPTGRRRKAVTGWVARTLALLCPAEPVVAPAAAPVVAPGSAPAVATTSLNASDDWYTMAEDLDRVRAVLGAIDLDPASCPAANASVCAARIYTIADDGLSRPWDGRVYCNPPFSSGMRDRFVDKAIASSSAGAEIIFLCDFDHSTDWCQALMKGCAAYALPKKRLKFWKPGGARRSPERGQIVAYFGPNVDRFRAVYSDSAQVIEATK